jgi:hypothetical protein
VVDDFAPTAKPRKKRAMSRLGQLFAAAIPIPVMNEMMQEMKIVPRRPKYLLRGAFDQHPMTAEQR